MEISDAPFASGLIFFHSRDGNSGGFASSHKMTPRIRIAILTDNGVKNNRVSDGEEGQSELPKILEWNIIYDGQRNGPPKLSLTGRSATAFSRKSKGHRDQRRESIEIRSKTNIYSSARSLATINLRNLINKRAKRTARFRSTRPCTERRAGSTKVVIEICIRMDSGTGTGPGSGTRIDIGNRTLIAIP
ncbi:hypothetical protein EVAR_49631_1 [Eumeta japonica]|uniref:Uncharacterized protein n=1 Tax=Eumeta variegata TaxID=151549 RepID=A0A4C1YC76_EUMVA|nr:hypothetical protein EVAR_49631_1 [Eumeta japonica]